MTQDVRTLLHEIDRKDSGEDRWFQDIRIGDWFYLSIQGGPDHESIPQAEVGAMEYEAFEVSLQTVHGVISYGKWGAWETLSQKPWAARFHSESPLLMVSGYVPVTEVQHIYEDLVAFAQTYPVP